MHANVIFRLTWLSLVCILVQSDESFNWEMEGRPYKANFTISLKDILGSKIESIMNRTYNATDIHFYSEPFSSETDTDVQWYLEVYFDIGRDIWLPVELKVWELPPNIASISGTVKCARLDANGTKLFNVRETPSVSKTSILTSPFIRFYYQKLTDIFDPQYRIVYEINAVLNYQPVLPTVDTVDFCNCNAADNQDLLKPYRATFALSLSDIVGTSIESMLDKTFLSTETSFKSKILSTKTEPDVQWYFRVHYDQKVNIYLHLSSLPSNVERVSAHLRCGQLYHNGKRSYFHERSSRESLITGSYFKKYPMSFTILYEDVEFNFDKQHRIYCDVYDAFLIYKRPATEEELKAKDDHLKLKEELLKMKNEIAKIKDSVSKMVEWKNEVVNSKGDLLKN